MSQADDLHNRMSNGPLFNWASRVQLGKSGSITTGRELIVSWTGLYSCSDSLSILLSAWRRKIYEPM